MLERWPPRLWAQGYNRATLGADALAALIVTVMLIPQSLAYAMLAGLPPEVGLYASVAPLVAYALLGSSRVLAVGPVAVVSLMTATALGDVAAPGTPQYVAAALTLALLSGGLLLLMGALRLGVLAHFLSHPVVGAFMSASALLIAAGQLKSLLGISASGTALWTLAPSLWMHLGQWHGLTSLVGLGSLLFLGLIRSRLKPALLHLGIGARWADAAVKTGPIVAVVGTAVWSWAVDAAEQGVRVVGHVPQGLPPLTLPGWDPALWQALCLPALLISVVGFVESVSVGQTLAAKRRQRVEPNQELLALGAGNVSAAFTGGMPVTGGFARSVVNFDAGAQTPLAGVLTAGGILLASLLLTPALFHLPQATLAATITVAVLSLVDLGLLRRTWRYAKSDFSAAVATLGGTLLLGVETGLVLGVGLSLALHLIRTSRPHIAEVGWVPGTEHFRNVLRHAVRVSPRLLSLRVDESLYFANSRTLEDRINAAVAERPALEFVVLQCSAINDIDASALESLEAIERRLQEAGVQLHMSEVKGPVMDRLLKTEFAQTMQGRWHLTHFMAVKALTPEVCDDASPQAPPTPPVTKDPQACRPDANG
ncbi:MAG: sulfate permease [Inhella sp.]|jgi:SulP family sulfate permease|uniref:SulP family inorganic anion transporter n=1 Tax=Inhella sp. TaxID=1921806 RepID=UPI0022C097C8|nr:sulfate permease [Inhella sp.]MCZ8235981.1 sulfate permease [Inhella sp.]